MARHLRLIGSTSAAKQEYLNSYPGAPMREAPSLSVVYMGRNGDEEGTFGELTTDACGISIVPGYTTAMSDLKAALDETLSLSERSNAFDNWKQFIIEGSSTAAGRVPYYSELLGLLITSVRKKDVSDFATQQLCVLLDVTLALGERSIDEELFQRTVNLVRQADIEIRIPFSGIDIEASVADALEGRFQSLLNRLES